MHRGKIIVGKFRSLWYKSPKHIRETPSPINFKKMPMQLPNGPVKNGLLANITSDILMMVLQRFLKCLNKGQNDPLLVQMISTEEATNYSYLI